MEKRNDTFVGEELISYIYAVLYSNKYRKTYNDYLKYDFPVVPIPTDANYFHEMVVVGKELIQTHLPDNFYRGKDETEILSELKKYSFDREHMSVKLNDSFLLPVKNADIYEMEIGGYKPIQKWLKDRKGLRLAKADIACLQRIIDAMQETVLLMERVDSIIHLD